MLGSGKYLLVLVIAFIVGMATFVSIQSAPPEGITGVKPSGNTTGGLTLESVAQHNTATNCWTIIDGKVYDITKYVRLHPGGPVITQACGKDSSELFSTKGGQGRDHSDFAKGLLADYLLGTLGANTIPPTTETVPETTPESILETIPTQTACISPTQAALHASRSDCWIRIGSTYYSITSYIPLHPGGSTVLLPYCGGKDATTAFATKGGIGNTHSSYAQNLLSSFRTGNSCDAEITTPLLSATILAPTPSQQFVAGTTQATLTVVTNQEARCKWNTADRAYETMRNSFSGSGTTQSTSITGLEDGKTYTRYIRCQDMNANQTTNTLSVTFSVAAPLDTNVILNATTVAKHNKASDCWIIVDGDVYDVTSYIPIHPGGASMITNYCGEDATTAFENKGGTGGTHSNNAKNLLASFKLGAFVTDTDILPPTMTITLPLSAQQLSGGTTSTTLSGTTNEAATCKWSFTDQTYSSMSGSFTITGATAQSATLTGLANGTTYTAFVRCQDTIGNVMTTSSSVSFSVTNIADTTPPTATITAPGANQALTVGTTSTTLSTTTNEPGTCKWSTTDVAYASMTNTFSTTGTTSHTTTISGLANGGSYTHYVRCSDTTGNAMTTSTSVSFSVNNLASYTAAQVATHNTQSNCWVIISSNVYDLTNYIPLHPGGQQAIINNCGTDATTAFTTKGGTGGTHSTNANNLLAGYRIGDVNDIVPPTTTITSPVANQVFTAGTTSAPLAATTNEASTCRWSTTNTAYNSMTNTLVGSGSTSHTGTVTGLTNGQTYTTYLRCQDTAGNAMTTSSSITFSVSNVADTTPPTATITAPTTNQAFSASTTSTTLSATTNEAATCRWSTSNQAYSSMPNTFTTTGTTSHTTTITGLASGTITRYVRCSDTAGNNMTTSASVTFSVTSSSAYTAAQVATHNTQSNCWVIISSNVYDLTNYIPLHPGGQQAIINNCGTDATTAFTTKGGTGGTHSTNANNLLAGYMIGSVTTVDSIPPVATLTAPGANQQLAGGTTSTTLSVSTDESATCRYSANDVAYTSMSAFSTTGARTHSVTLTGLSNGQSYTYYVLCTDASSNLMQTSVSITFSVGTEADTTPPTASFTSPTNNQALTTGTTSTTLSLTSNEPATCKWSANDQTYAAMPNTFSTTGTTSHTTTMTGLANGQSYMAYALCQDAAGNTMSPSTSVTFSVASPPTYTMAQVATHSTLSSCWIVVQSSINNGVFDMGGFASTHPGGRQAIEINCGKNATRTFDRQDGHRNSERQSLNGFWIGYVG